MGVTDTEVITELIDAELAALKAGATPIASPLHHRTDYLATLSAYVCAIPRLWRTYDEASPASRAAARQDLIDITRLALRTALGGANEVLHNRLLNTSRVLHDRLAGSSPLLQPALAVPNSTEMPRELLEALIDGYVSAFTAVGAAALHSSKNSPRTIEVLPNIALLLAATLVRAQDLPTEDTKEKPL